MLLLLVGVIYKFVALQGSGLVVVFRFLVNACKSLFDIGAAVYSCLAWLFNSRERQCLADFLPGFVTVANRMGVEYMIDGDTILLASEDHWLPLLGFTQSYRCTWSFSTFPYVERVEWTRPNYTVRIKCVDVNVICKIRTREAVKTWLLLARRLGLCKDVRCLIGQWIWACQSSWERTTHKQRRNYARSLQ